jgi:hypothetical protein
MTPATLGTGFATRVTRFCNAAEQRWASRGQYGLFVLTLTNMSGYDLSDIRDFFRTVKWRFDTTWSLAINGATYSNMILGSDDLVVTEQKPNLFTRQATSARALSSRPRCTALRTSATRLRRRSTP